MTIDEFKEKVAPYMDEGYVAMNKDCSWWWFNVKPMINIEKEEWDYDDTCSGLSYMFNIEPVENWTRSLIKVGGKND